MNYFEFYPGDYLRDTTRLQLVDHGAYLRLLIAYYSEETPLPADLQDLYVITCAVSKSDKDAVKRVADRFFPVSEEDGLRHKNRVDEEIAKAQKRIAAARANGAKGGKKSGPDKNPPANPVGTPPGNPLGTQRGSPAGTQPHTHSGEALHTPYTTNSERERAGASQGTPEDSQLPGGVDPERWASYRDQLADDGKLSISRIKTALMQLRRVSQAGHDPNAVLTAAVMRGLRDLDDCAARLAREKAPPVARAGPGHAPPQSRQLQAINALNEVTEHVTQDRTTAARLADSGTAGRTAQAGLPEPGVATFR